MKYKAEKTAGVGATISVEGPAGETQSALVTQSNPDGHMLVQLENKHVVWAHPSVTFPKKSEAKTEKKSGPPAE